jgi:hypothetical protein
MAARSARIAIAIVAAASAACGPMNHAPIRPDLLDKTTGRASPPLPQAPPGKMRVAVYGDSQGNSAAHRAVVAAILKEKPDLVLFAGDAIDHLPAGHMPDWGGWQYLVPIWPQYVRGYAWVSLLTIIPFPAAIHETLLGAVAPPRPPPDLNGWLEDTEPLRAAGIPILAAPGNHDEYHLVDQAQFARMASGTRWTAATGGSWCSTPGPTCSATGIPCRRAGRSSPGSRPSSQTPTGRGSAPSSSCTSPRSRRGGKNEAHPG